MKFNTAQKILTSLLLALLFVRFFFPSFASFSHDETALQALVEKNYVNGTFPTHGLAGSEGLHYGPVPQWIYLSFRSLTPNLLTIISFYTALFCTAFLIVGITLRRAYGAAAWLVLLLALSSPWLFVYSRLAWDNSFLALFSALIFLSVQQISQKKGIAPWILLGLASGAAVSTHLMCLPVVAAACLVSLLSLSRAPFTTGKKFAFLSAAAGAAILVNIPYLAYLFSEGLKETGPKERWGDGRQAWWIFLRSTSFVSTWNWKYFLQPFEADFFSWLAPWKATLFKLDFFGWLLKFLVWGSIFSVVSSLFRRKKIEPLSIFAVSAVTIHLLLLQFLDLKTHPHYYIAIWWFPYWALTWFAARIKNKEKIRKALKIVIACAIATNLFLLFEFHSWLYVSRGTRGDFFPTIVGDQIDTALEICDRAKSLKKSRVTVDLSTVRMDAKLFSFLPSRYSRCTGFSFDVSDKKFEVGERSSPAHIINSPADFVIVYSDKRDNSAALEVHERRQK